MQQNTTIIIILILAMVLCFLATIAFRKQYIWEAARRKAEAAEKHAQAVKGAV